VNRHSLQGDVENPGDRTVDELLDIQTARLGKIINDLGIEAAARLPGLDPDMIAAIADGDASIAGQLDLEAVATLLASSEGTPSATALLDEALDELLFGMTTGVLNVDVVAGELDADLGPREVQQVLEGRHPVTLRDFLELQRLIASRSR
jgi:hypothetical protein